MLYRLVRPMRRKGSRNAYFEQRIPADVRDRAVGGKIDVPCGETTVPITITDSGKVRFSLRTADPSQVKVRQGEAAAFLETIWRALRQDEPIPLLHRQAVALAGRLYRGWTSGREVVRSITYDLDESGQPLGFVLNDTPDRAERIAEWETALDKLQKIDGPRDLEQLLGPIIRRLLLAEGIKQVDRATWQTLLDEFREAMLDAFERRKREAEGNYAPDPKSGRFPEWQAPGSGPHISLTGLVEDWWREAQATGLAVSTYESYRNTMRRFVAFLGHDDAARVGTEDVIAFKDNRLAAGISPKTVKDSDIAGLKSIFGFAVSNLHLPSNPAAGVTLKLGKKLRTRDKGFTANEATAILSLALHHQCGRERPKTCAAKRWVPWLCAYTGARVGEICQLRKQDVRSEGEHWIITITPEAGTVKTKEMREVPLHAHLIEIGFASFVEGATDGYLFANVRPGKKALRGGVANRVREFVRAVVADPKVAPNHAWRHLFMTIGFDAGIQERVLDAICGHAPRYVGGTYGDVSMKAKVDAIERLPRFEVEQQRAKSQVARSA
jgi:integrase